MNNCQLDNLPVELIHHILSYFAAHEIFYTFTNVSSYLDAILIAYPSYQINFKSITKKNFDLVCQQIKPDQVIKLILSDDENTPGVELFLSRFQINQFTHLQSLRLIDIDPDFWEIIITKLIELKNLRSFSFISPTRLYPWICSVAPQLKSLETILYHNEPSTEIIYPLAQLNRLVLRIEGEIFNMLKYKYYIQMFRFSYFYK